MTSVPKGQNVNRAELAGVFGVSVVTVDTWRRAGCPVVQRGSKGVAWTFNTADVSQWLRDAARREAEGKLPDDAEQLELRKQSAITGKHELELAKLRGEVAPLDQIERAVANAFAELKTNLRTIPGRVVVSLIGETDERRFKEVLLSEIDQALTALAETDLVGDDPGDEIDEIDEGSDGDG